MSIQKIEVMVNCPFHSDSHASMSINVEKMIAYCFTCGKGYHVSQLPVDIQNLVGYVPDSNFTASTGVNIYTYVPEKTDNKITEVCRYDYKDQTGKLIYQVIRYEPKDFKQYDVIHNTWSLKQVKRLPYRLPELITAIKNSEPVFITEGEKDSDSLFDLGFNSSTWSGGCNNVGHWEEFMELLPDNGIFHLLPDQDEPGKKAMETLSQILIGHGHKCFVIETLPIGKDITDYLDTIENDRQKRQQAIESLVQTAKEALPAMYQMTSIQDIYESQSPSFLIEDFLYQSTLVLIDSQGGLGKSYLSMFIGISIADQGKLFGKFQVNQKGKVLVVDEENPLMVLKDRYTDSWIQNENDIRYIHFKNVDLGDDESFTRLKNTVEQYKPILLILDSLVALHSLDENSSKDMRFILSRLRYFTNKNITVILLHHTDKGGKMYRGSSDIRNACDVELSLEKQDDDTILLRVTKERLLLPVLRKGIKLRLNNNNIELISENFMDLESVILSICILESQFITIYKEALKQIKTGETQVRNSIRYLIGQGKLDMIKRGKTVFYRTI